MQLLYAEACHNSIKNAAPGDGAKAAETCLTFMEFSRSCWKRMSRSYIVTLKLAGLVVALATVAVLFAFAPDRHWFYPRCGLYSLTGLQCPGCGSLRAIHQLLRGNLSLAFQLNPLFIVLTPVLALVFVWRCARAKFGYSVPNLFEKSFWLWLLVLISLVFGIARNLPALHF